MNSFVNSTHVSRTSTPQVLQVHRGIIDICLLCVSMCVVDMPLKRGRSSTPLDLKRVLFSSLTREPSIRRLCKKIKSLTCWPVFEKVLKLLNTLFAYFIIRDSCLIIKRMNLKYEKKTIKCIYNIIFRDTSLCQYFIKFIAGQDDYVDRFTEFRPGAILRFSLDDKLSKQCLLSYILHVSFTVYGKRSANDVFLTFFW